MYYLRKITFLLLLTIFSYFVVYPHVSHVEAYYTNQPASFVLGQSDFTRNGVQGGILDLTRGYYYPYSVFSDGTRLYVADTYNHRVLIYNTIPTSLSATPDVVVGQPDLISFLANQGGSAAANTLNYPEKVYSDGTKLFIADRVNNRVLIYNTIPTSNNASADVVVGQANFTSTGTATSASRMRNPRGIWVDSGKLFIADVYNHRVLIYNSVPATNGASADVVVGQSTYSAKSANQGGSVAANTLNYPNNVQVYGGKMMITDSSNNRVLIYNSVPTSSNASADTVVCQDGMTTSVSDAAANRCYNPVTVQYDGTNFFVLDRLNSRILVYNGIPSSDGASANDVVGQVDLISNDTGTSNRSLQNPRDIAVVNNKLYIADLYNHRIVEYSEFTSTSTATMLIGQLDYTSSGANYLQESTLGQDGLNQPWGVWSDGTRLFVADTSNNRVLIYNTIPTSGDVTPDVVVGQPDFTSNSGNQGGSIAANTLYYPVDVLVIGEKMLIADGINGRVLIYNSIPTENNASADLAIGQVDLISDDSVYGSPTQTSLYQPRSVSYNAATQQLFIQDGYINRILVYNGIPTSNGVAADIVIGQPDFTTRNCGYTASKFCTGGLARVFDGKIFHMDTHRALILNSIPTANYTAADVVIGQSDFTSYSANQGSSVGANTLKTGYPHQGGFAYDGTRLFLADSINQRVLIFNEIPTSNNESADMVLGQADFSSNSINTGSTVSRYSMYTPTGIEYIDNKVFVADTYNHRVLAFENTFSHTLTATSDIPDKTNITSATITGSAVSTSTTISGVQWSTTSTFSGTWNECAADDDSFDSTTEVYTCTVDLEGEGAKTLYVRAYDENTAYTMFSNYGQIGTIVDTSSPSTSWVDDTGETRIFEMHGESNILSSIDKPSFTFTITEDTSEISKYQILTKKEGEDWTVYIDDIPPTYPPFSTLPYIYDKKDVHISYDKISIFVHLKEGSDTLSNGAYRYKVRAIDRAGNTTDTQEKILRLNTYTSNFTGEYFPLTIEGLGGNNIQYANYNYTVYDDPINHPSFTTYTTTPTIWGIAPVNTNITLTLEQDEETITEHETTANDQSNWGINITDPLPIGTYTMILMANRNSNDYTQLPLMTLTVRGGTTTIADTSVQGTQDNNQDKDTDQDTNTSEDTQEDTDEDTDTSSPSTPATLPEPSFLEKIKRLLLFWK